MRSLHTYKVIVRFNRVHSLEIGADDSSENDDEAQTAEDNQRGEEVQTPPRLHLLGDGAG